MLHRKTANRFRIYHLVLLSAMVYAICVSPLITQPWVIGEIRRSGGRVGISTATLGGIRGQFASVFPDAFGKIAWVDLAHIPVKRVWLKTVARSDTITMLWLQDSGISDADLRLLAGNRTLRELYLNGNQITDQGLQNLGNLPSLERLELNHTEVEHPAIAADSMSAIWMLKLRGTRVSDAAIAEIAAKMPKIREVDFSKTNVTDVAIRHLSAMRNLESVNLQDSKTSSAEAYHLHAALEPNCTIFDVEGKCLVAQRYR